MTFAIWSADCWVCLEGRAGSVSLSGVSSVLSAMVTGDWWWPLSVKSPDVNWLRSLFSSAAPGDCFTARRGRLIVAARQFSAPSCPPSCPVCSGRFSWRLSQPGLDCHQVTTAVTLTASGIIKRMLASHTAKTRQDKTRQILSVSAVGLRLQLVVR